MIFSSKFLLQMHKNEISKEQTLEQLSKNHDQIL